MSAEFDPAAAVGFRPAGGLPVRPPQPRLPRRGGGSGPPPIVEVRLESNPELWSPRDTATFIASTQARILEFCLALPCLKKGWNLITAIAMGI